MEEKNASQEKDYVNESKDAYRSIRAEEKEKCKAETKRTSLRPLRPASREKDRDDSLKLISPARPYITTRGTTVKSAIDTGKDPHTATRINHRPNSVAKTVKTEAQIATLPWNDPNKELKREPLYPRPTSRSKESAQPKRSNDGDHHRHEKSTGKGALEETKEVKDAKPQRHGMISGFELDLQGISDDDVAMAKSYNLSASGTMDIVGFQIKQEGLSKTPERKFCSKGDDVQRNIMILSVLGKGAGGVVHKGLYLPTLQLVAVKVIPIFESDKRHQMVSELQTLYTNLVPLNAAGPMTNLCPFIVSFYDAFINPNNGTISVVVEYMDGGSLQNIVDTGGCSSEEVLAKICSHVLQGLTFLHDRHQIHRDIKPSNLLIDHKGQVKISDFGIARSLSDSKECAKTFVGTLVYMSPERITGDEYSYNSDVWSLGLSILTCALGKFPFASNGYWETYNSLQLKQTKDFLPSDISPEFSDFLQNCLEKDKTKRPNAKELLEHSFVKEATVTELSRLANLDFEDDQKGVVSKEDYETAVQELDTILTKLNELYTKEFQQKHASDMLKSSADSIVWLKSLPVAKKTLLEHLSSQMALPKTVLYEKAKALLKDLSEIAIQTIKKN